MTPTEKKAGSLSETGLGAHVSKVKERMLVAGVSYVIRNIEELPTLIQTINSRLNP